MSKSPSNVVPEGYSDWLSQLKADITRTQQKVVQTVNQELLQLYKQNVASLRLQAHEIALDSLQ